MNKIEDVVAGTKWHNRGRTLTILEVFADNKDRVEAFHGDCAFRMGAEGRREITFRSNVVEWGVLVPSHKIAAEGYSPKGMRFCTTCCELWPVVAREPATCTPTQDSRPPQIIMEEKIQQLMDGVVTRGT